MRLRLAIAVSLSVAAGGTAASLPPSQDWPSFRGRRASGVQEGHATATTWNVEKGEGVRFRVKVPGLAHSSPVVWGDSVYLTSAISNGEAPLKVGLYQRCLPAPARTDKGTEFALLNLKIYAMQGRYHRLTAEVGL